MLGRKATNKVLALPIDKIFPNPAQPRLQFTATELDSLSESIRRNGLLQPISVRYRPDGSYELISGERRLRACRQLGYTRINAIVHDMDEKQSAVFAMIENLQRADLNCFEEARGIHELIYQWEITQEEAASKLGMAQSTLANKLRLLQLPQSIQGEIVKHGLTERHARALLKLRESDLQEKALHEIVDKQMNVAQTDAYIQKLLAPEAKKPTRLLVVKDLRIFVQTIDKAISAMKQAGIQADVSQTDEEEYIQYTVKIPKKIGLPYP